MLTISHLRCTNFELHLAYLVADEGPATGGGCLAPGANGLRVRDLVVALELIRDHLHQLRYHRVRLGVLTNNNTSSFSCYDYIDYSLLVSLTDIMKKKTNVSYCITARNTLNEFIWRFIFAETTCMYVV